MIGTRALCFTAVISATLLACGDESQNPVGEPVVLPDLPADEDASVIPDATVTPDATTPKPDAGPGDASKPDADAAVPPKAGPDATVKSFDKTHVYFAGADNKRIVDTRATFPATGSYRKIILHLALDCPSGKCDFWDRFGTLGLVKPGVNGGAETVIEIARYMTPYRVAGKWDIDVTDLRPILSGNVGLRGFIDTWVGPGSQYGEGWLLSATFEMTGGLPARDPIAVVPIWTMRSAVYGDPGRPMNQAIPPQDVAIPSGSAYAVRTIITGHGQGNAGNCAEFCSKSHKITSAGKAHSATIWRDDCATTATPNQAGTFTYSRAGWCPGADVRAWTVDVSADLHGLSTARFAYEPQGYDNTCRPSAPTCTGCTLGTGCAYDNGNHTEPQYYVSSALIVYR